MPIEEYVEYQRREYCRDVACPVQTLLDKQEPASEQYEEVRRICKTHCVRTTYDFHHWLIERGYEIVRPE